MTTMLNETREPIDREEPRVTALYEGPRTRAVLLEQLGLTGLLLRGGGVFYGALLLLALALPFLTISGSPAHAGGQRANVSNLTFTPEISIVMVFLALIVPLIVWRDEDPSRRDYHWLMPVSRRKHTLLRVAAGWCWTMVATLFFLLVIAALPVIVQHRAGVPQPYHVGFSAWEWLVPFAAASVGYALASVAAVTTQRPLVWVFGSLASYAGIVLVMLTQGMQRVAARLLHVWDGPFGLRPVLQGVDATSGGFASPDVAHWLAATALWGGIAIAFLWFTSSVRWRS